MRNQGAGDSAQSQWSGVSFLSLRPAAAAGRGGPDV